MLILACKLAFSDDSSELPQEQKINDGIYENNGHFFVIKNNVMEAEVLKSFYGFWYDGEYPLEKTETTNCLTQINGSLYIDWWKRIDLAENESSGGVFWAPGSNISEYALNPYPVKDKLYGWFIVDDLIYEITYWKADIDYSNELASFMLPDGKEAFVHKHIQFGDTVYTCASGRRTAVRNPALKAGLPGTPLYDETSLVMVFGEPYLTRADITDMKEEIASHNAIVYPPRFSTMEMKEPSIYKKLEDMPISW